MNVRDLSALVEVVDLIHAGNSPDWTLNDRGLIAKECLKVVMTMESRVISYTAKQIILERLDITRSELETKEPTFIKPVESLLQKVHKKNVQSP